MTRRSKVRFGAAVVFSLANLGAAVMAAAAGELIHASVHAGLLLLGAYYASRIWFAGAAVIPDLEASSELTDRLTHLELSIEAAATAVERVGEGQRFLTRVLSENDYALPSGKGAAERIEIKAPEETPQDHRP